MSDVEIRDLERRVSHLERERVADVAKMDGVLQAVVDMHQELLRLRADLPTIIARSVAPLLPPLRDED